MLYFSLQFGHISTFLSQTGVGCDSLWQGTGTNQRHNPLKKKQKKGTFFDVFRKYFNVHSLHMIYFTFCTDL